MNLKKKILLSLLCIVILFGISPISAIADGVQNDSTSNSTEQIEELSPTDVQEFNGHYYAYFPSGMLWNDAKEYCESLGGHLVCITTKEENDFIVSIIESDIIIGLSDVENEGVWKWVSGENVHYMNFRSGEPNNEFNEDYACLAQSDGTWNDGHCERELWNFVCEWESDVQIPSDAEIYDGHSYKVFDLSMTWKDAKTYCESLGGHLATITSEEEQKFITSIYETTTKTQLWLGGTDESQEGSWQWITGEDFVYQNWNSSSPDNFGGSEHYLTMLTDNTPEPSSWNDFTNVGYIPSDISGLYLKLEQIGFICEWDNAINAEGEETIAILTTEKSLCVQTNESMWLAFGLMKNGLLQGDWRKMAITVSDPTVVELSEYEETEYGYSIEVKGKKQGTTSLTITDTESGLNTSCIISVYDTYTKSYSYYIEDIASFYPNNKWESHIPTNIYDLNGLYVSNYSCTKSGTTYYVSMDIYNHMYHTGAVDVYDADNNWINSYPIEKYTDISSIWDTGEQAFYLIADPINGKWLTYQQATFSKHTSISNIAVPEGGHIVISNNFSKSVGTFFYNASEILFDATVTLLEVAVGNVDKSDFIRMIMDEVLDDPVKREAWMEIFTSTLQADLESFAKNLLAGETSDAYSNFADDYEDALNALNINWKNFFQSSTGVIESAFTKFTGPAGAALEACFAFTKYGNEVLRAINIATSIDEPYATVFSSIDDGYINPHGVVVNTGENIDTEAVLQVFKVSNSDTLDVVLDSDNPLEKYELYNIGFVKNDANVQPNGNVKVHIPIPKDMVGNSGKVYRQEDDGSWTMLDAYVEGNYFVFETEHFSLYAVVGDTAELVIKELPSKTEYVVGETLNTEGLILELNGQEITSGYICEPTVLYGRGEQEITVVYGSSKATFNVYIDGAEVIIDGKTYYYAPGYVFPAVVSGDTYFIDENGVYTIDLQYLLNSEALSENITLASNDVYVLTTEEVINYLDNVGAAIVSSDGTVTPYSDIDFYVLMDYSNGYLKSGDTVTLFADMYYDAQSAVAMTGREIMNITVDLNGHTVAFASSYQLLLASMSGLDYTGMTVIFKNGRIVKEASGNIFMVRRGIDVLFENIDFELQRSAWISYDIGASSISFKDCNITTGSSNTPLIYRLCSSNKAGEINFDGVTLKGENITLVNITGFYSTAVTVNADNTEMYDADWSDTNGCSENVTINIKGSCDFTEAKLTNNFIRFSKRVINNNYAYWLDGSITLNIALDTKICDDTFSAMPVKNESVNYNDLITNNDECTVDYTFKVNFTDGSKTYDYAYVSNGTFKPFTVKSSLTLYSDFTINFYVPINNFTFDEVLINGVSYILNDCPIFEDTDGTKYYKVTVQNIAANMAAEDLNIIFKGANDSIEKTFSVIQYCNILLSNNNYSDSYALATSVIKYTNDAYDYAGSEKPNALISAIASEAYKNYLPKPMPVTETATNKGNLNVAISGAQLDLGSSLRFRFNINPAFTGVLKVDGQSYNITEAGSIAYVNVAMRAYDMYDPEKFITISGTASDGTEFSGTYDLRAYINGSDMTIAKLKNILSSFYTYCVEAYSYKYGTTVERPIKYSEGLEYELSEDGTYYIVTGIGECPDTDLVIPPTYEGLPVKEIGTRAFNSTNLTSVTIGNGITSIGAYSFGGCASLVDLTIGENVNTISAGAFVACTSLKTVIIPDSVTYIGEYAFSDCSVLQTVVIGKNLKRVCEFAFSSCDISIVYYKGTGDEWDSISISDMNELDDDIRYYYSKTEPAPEGKFWHYVDGVPTIWPLSTGDTPFVDTKIDWQ